MMAGAPWTSASSKVRIDCSRYRVQINVNIYCSGVYIRSCSKRDVATDLSVGKDRAYVETRQLCPIRVEGRVVVVNEVLCRST